MDNSQTIDLTAKPFRVGPWVVTPDRHEWRCDHDVRRVPPRLMLLLRCLARTAGSTVTRESLLEEVWERRVLNDEVLSRSIADLRQALDDDARVPRFVQTIPKLGYRLIAEVEFALDMETRTAPPVRDLMGIEDDSAQLVANLASPDTLIAHNEADLKRAESVSAPGKLKRKAYSNAVLTVILVALLLALPLIWLMRAADSAAQVEIPARQNEPRVAALSSAELLLARPLTSAAGMEFSPRFSRDGQWLAYAVAKPPEPGSYLLLRSRDGSVQRQFTPTSGAEDVCPVFVGTDLIWTRQHQGRCQLLKQPLLADTPQVLGPCASVRSCPDISADATQLVFTAPAADARHGNGLVLLNLNNGSLQPLTAPLISAGNDLDPRFSPQAEVSFVRGVEAVQSLWQIPAKANAKPRRAALADSMIFGQAFLPDGRLLIASDALGFRALLKLEANLSAGSASPQLLGARGARYPDVASDGSVVYELASYDANLWRYRANAKPQKLTPSSRYEAYPMISPDAQTLLYQSNQHGLEAIYSVSLTGDEPAATELPLPLAPGDRWAHPAFQQGRNALWLTRYGPEHTEVWQYVTGAQAAQRAPGFPLGAHDASDDAQAQHVWFLLGDAPPVKLMRRGIAEDAIAEVVAEDVLSYRSDPRGLFLVYQNKQDQLWHCPAAPNMHSCVQLPLHIASGYARNWTLSDHALYYVEEPAKNAPYRFSSRYDFASQKTETLDIPAPSTLSHGLAVARDESVIIVAQLDTLAIDLYWWLAPKR